MAQIIEANTNPKETTSVVLNMFSLKEEILKKVSLLKGVDSLKPADLSPMDEDLVAVMLNGDERWTSYQPLPDKDGTHPVCDWTKPHSVEVGISEVPKGKQFLILSTNCEDAAFDSEYVLILDDARIYTA